MSNKNYITEDASKTCRKLKAVIDSKITVLSRNGFSCFYLALDPFTLHFITQSSNLWKTFAAKNLAESVLCVSVCIGDPHGVVRHEVLRFISTRVHHLINAWRITWSNTDYSVLWRALCRLLFDFRLKLFAEVGNPSSSNQPISFMLRYRSFPLLMLHRSVLQLGWSKSFEITTCEILTGFHYKKKPYMIPGIWSDTTNKTLFISPQCSFRINQIPSKKQNGSRNAPVRYTHWYCQRFGNIRPFSCQSSWFSEINSFLLGR